MTCGAGDKEHWLTQDLQKNSHLLNGTHRSGDPDVVCRPPPSSLGMFRYAFQVCAAVRQQACGALPEHAATGMEQFKQNPTMQ